MKLLHIKNTTTKQYLNLIPIKTEWVCSEFVNKSELFPPQLLRGHLLNHRNFKNVQRKCCLVYLSRMHRKSRFVPFIFTEATSMTVGPIVAFLCGLAKINLIFDTQFADPHVYNIFGLTVDMAWDADNFIVQYESVLIVYQGALHATTPIATLWVSCNIGDVQLLVPHHVVTNWTPFFQGYDQTCVTNKLFQFPIKTV